MATEKKKLKKSHIVLIVLACLVVVAVAVIVPVVLSLNTPEERNVVANVTVTGYHSVEGVENVLFQDAYRFEAEDVDTLKESTAVNEELFNPTDHIRLQYYVQNTTEEEYAYTLDLSNLVNNNCALFYDVDDDGEHEIVENSVVVRSSRNCRISLIIRIDNPRLDANLSGSVVFSVSAV